MTKPYPCHPRRVYYTEGEANMACKHIAETQKISRYPIYCPSCDGYHLSPVERKGDARQESEPPSLPETPAPMPAELKACLRAPEFKTVTEKVALESGGRWVRYEDIERLLLGLDVALNGPGSAKAPTLADIVGQAEKVAREINSPLLPYIKWTIEE